MDAALADYFFALFYGELVRDRADLASAFRRSWARARVQPHARRATGIALWSAETLQPPRAAARQAASLSHAQDAPTRLITSAARELNYAVLHNAVLRSGRSSGLFTQFEVWRGGAKAGEVIEADVEVHLGREKATWRKCLTVREEDDRWDFAGEIHVPLTADLVRSVREAVNSSVVAQLTVGGRLQSRESHRVRLLPVDQWRDNETDGQWLPSFVLPRDAAVTAAVRDAQRYVRVLRDDPTAGFEGYQVTDERTPSEAQLAEVDLQAQAIWATLLHDWRLGYINPPPSYSAELDSQRLRTPTTVKRHGAGTCIDLALLLAACLELVDIYPVIFLLEGHALAGYWRHDAYHRAFTEAVFPHDREAAIAPRAPGSTADTQAYPWQTRGGDAHRELVRRIEARQLVPLETVRLTEHCGFVPAVEAGIAALARGADFHSMLDIVRARQHGVTPLPVIDAEAAS